MLPSDPRPPLPSPPPVPVAAGRGAASGRGGVAAWLIAVLLAVAAYAAWLAYDQLQHRLLDSTERYEESTRRFERWWSLYDRATASTLALKWDSAEAGGALHDDHVRAFAADAAALLAEGARPGAPLLSQAGAYEAATRRLSAMLGAPGAALSPALVRQQAQQVQEKLAVLGREARQRQAATAFPDDVDRVRRQVLGAVAGIVAMLVLVVALAVQGGVQRRREHALRARAEKLAAVAEAERARAEDVARDKARFLGMLSHELLTPLQSIWSTMDLIESRGRVEVREPAFARLRESTRVLRGRISDLVDFAKMSAGRLETRIRGFQLDKLVDAALRDLEEPLAMKNLDVHWEAPAALTRRLYSDPARLRQVLDNLLTNAVKYTERGGISVNAALSDDGAWLRLEVADTGVGIQPGELDHLFEPFYRSPATAGMAAGSGLGLAVVRSLVDLMGGTIRFESVPGQGTTVSVAVPVAPGPEIGVDATAAAPDAEPVPLGALRRPVLVVDDMADARLALSEVLRGLGVEVDEADGGRSALAAAARRDYLAVFLDMQMPDLGGDEVARRLRTPGHRQSRSFLVLVSAGTDLDDAAVHEVFDARIDKPAARRELADALARAVARSPDGRPGAAAGGRDEADASGGIEVTDALAAGPARLAAGLDADR